MMNSKETWTTRSPVQTVPNWDHKVRCLGASIPELLLISVIFSTAHCAWLQDCKSYESIRNDKHTYSLF